MNSRRTVPFLLVIILVGFLLSNRHCNKPAHVSPASPSAATAPSPSESPAGTTSQDDGLNRNPSRMHYTKHARCRMGCRHIDEAEILQILKNGTINYRKSELEGEPCRHKYAVEGNTSDNQRLRVIFAPCGDEMTVVTCIDLDREWPCDCPGDHH
ncbi:MAG: DUF4258 domain-containing protein [Sediminibacterium magnilacihabitans]|jgi:hypothetical protein|nr:DUF4258 domain-containing protein [Sediminibacterium magnilacihabitans]PQV59537.1 uncharacterized protein DUF4258 [Sediminibacterium magnilacihabitans]